MKTLKTIFLSLTLLVAFAQVKAQDATSSSPIGGVLTAYFGVKNALTTDNNEATKSKAKELLAAVTAVQTGSLTAEQKTLWTSYADKLSFDSRHISESAAIDHQREHFASLSKNMIEVVKGLKLNTAVVYQQYCPMKKSSWLSESAAIRNPYYGKQMLTCGKTTETLTPSTK
jgi:hypothetical protein